MSRHNHRWNNGPVPDEIAEMGYTRAAQWDKQYGQLDYLNFWIHRLNSLALASFQWDGFPEEIDPLFIERCLLHFGIGGMFNMAGAGEEFDSMPQYAFTQATQAGNLNLYWNPNRVQLTTLNSGTSWFRHAYYWGATKVAGGTVLHEPDCVLAYDTIDRMANASVITTKRYIRMFATRLAAIDDIVDQNMRMQRHPYMFYGPEQSRRDMTNMYARIAGGDDILFLNRGAADMVQFDVLQTMTPYVADKLLVDQRKILNMALDMLGINNTNTEKRERMITDEATANDEDIALMRLSRLRAREQFADNVNKRWGLNVSVKYGDETMLADNESLGDYNRDASGAARVDSDSDGVVGDLGSDEPL